MNKTNVQYYGAGFDANGRRIVSKICEFDPEKERNSDKVSALINEIKAMSEDIAVAEIINADAYDQYLNGDASEIIRRGSQLNTFRQNRLPKKRKPVLHLKLLLNTPLSSMS